MKKSLFFKLVSLTLTMLLASCGSSGLSGNNPNDPGEGGETGPNGDKYQVSESYWSNNITNMGYFGPNTNVTFDMTMSMGTVIASEVKLENNNEDIYIDLLDNGSYDYYVLENEVWQKYNVPAAQMAMFSNMYTELIRPWNITDFTYDSDKQAYFRASDTASYTDEQGNAYTVNLQNIYLKFEDNKFVSLKYEMTSEGQIINAQVLASKWGSTSFTFPSVGGSGATDIPVTDLVLDKQSLELKVGDIAQINATVMPENATNKRVTYVSENTEIVVISGNTGLLQAISVGETRIAVSAGDITRYCAVTVKDNTPITLNHPFKDVMIQYKAGSFSLDGGTYILSEEEEAMVSAIHVYFHATASGTGTYYIFNEQNNVVSDVLIGTYEFEKDGNEYNAYLEDVDAYYNAFTNKYLHGDNIVQFNEALLLPTFFNYSVEDEIYTTNSYVSKNYHSENYILKGKYEFIKSNETFSLDLPEDPHDDNYETLLADKLFRYVNITKKDDKVDITDEELANFDKMLKDSTISFFSDTSVEFLMKNFSLYEKLTVEDFHRGTYSVKLDAQDENIYSVLMTSTEEYMDGEAQSGSINYFMMSFDVVTNELNLLMSNNGQIGLLAHYKLDTLVPTHYMPTKYDNWNVDAVREAILEAGFISTLPKLEDVKTFTISEVTNNSFTINMTLSYKGYSTYGNYNSLLGDAGFKLTYDSETQSVYHISPEGDYELRTDLDRETYAVTFVVSSHVVYYPANEITDYLKTSLKYEGSFPTFQFNEADKYDFSSGVLYIMLQSGVSASNVARDAITLLTRNNFTANEISGVTYYVSQDNKISVIVSPYEDSSMPFVTIAISEMQSMPVAEYPGNEIEEYLRGVEDSYIDFSNEYAIGYDTYAPFEEVRNQAAFELYITLPNDVSASEVANSFIDNLVELDYVQLDFKYVIREGEDDEVTLSTYGAYVSPNNQVAFVINGFDYNPGSGYNTSSCYIQMFNINNFDGRVILPVVEPSMNSLEVFDYTETYSVGDEFIFDGTVYALYNNGSIKEIELGNYYVNGNVDTNEVGEYELIIAFNGFEETITIYVIEKEVEYIEYSYIDVTEGWDPYGHDAIFMVYVWGGSEGTQWIETDYYYDEELGHNVFTFYAPEDIEGCIIVRLNPEVFESGNFEEVDSIWDFKWNQSGDLSPLPSDLPEANRNFVFFED